MSPLKEYWLWTNAYCSAVRQSERHILHDGDPCWYAGSGVVPITGHRSEKHANQSELKRWDQKWGWHLPTYVAATWLHSGKIMAEKWRQLCMCNSYWLILDYFIVDKWTILFKITSMHWNSKQHLFLHYNVWKKVFLSAYIRQHICRYQHISVIGQYWLIISADVLVGLLWAASMSSKNQLTQAQCRDFGDRYPQNLINNESFDDLELMCCGHLG